jgi:hypothetical protein
MILVLRQAILSNTSLESLLTPELDSTRIGLQPSRVTLDDAWGSLGDNV